MHQGDITSVWRNCLSTRKWKEHILHFLSLGISVYDFSRIKKILRIFSFSQRCCWGFSSSGTWRCVARLFLIPLNPWRWLRNFASQRWKLLTTNTSQKTRILIKSLYSSLSRCGLNILLQYNYGRTYLWRPQGRSSGQRWADEGHHGADLPRVWTGNWNLHTTGIGVWTWRSLWWSRHSWHTVNMTSTLPQIWNTRGLALDIANGFFSRGSAYHFNPMEHMQFRHFRLKIRADFWNKNVLIMLYCVSNNFSLSLSLSLSLSPSPSPLSFGLAVKPGF